MPQISKMAVEEVAALRAAGVEPTVEEIVWLNDLGMTAEAPAGEAGAMLRGSPVRVGNVVLHPWTIASHSFYRATHQHCRTEAGSSLLLAFALAHGTDPSAYAGLLTSKDVLDAINAWAMTCTATLQELRQGIERVCPAITEPQDLEPSTGKRGGYEGILAQLVAGTGLNEDYWAARPVGTLHKYIHAIYAQRLAGVSMDADDAEYRQANLQFLKASEAIRVSRRPGREHDDSDARSHIEKAADILRDAHGIR